DQTLVQDQLDDVRQPARAGGTLEVVTRGSLGCDSHHQASARAAAIVAQLEGSASRRSLRRFSRSRRSESRSRSSESELFFSSSRDSLRLCASSSSSPSRCCSISSGWDRYSSPFAAPNSTYALNRARAASTSSTWSSSC